MVAKMGQELKRERNRIKRAKIDRTTNSYMINLAWGIFVIIILRFIEAGYSSANTVLAMPTFMKTMAVIFGLVSIGLLICGFKNVLNKKSRFLGYSGFSISLTLGSLWIGFYAEIRNIFIGINPAIANIDSRWWISRSLIILVAVYLVITLILTSVKIKMIEKGKK